MLKGRATVQVVPFYEAFADATRAHGAALWSDVEIFVNHGASGSGPASLMICRTNHP